MRHAFARKSNAASGSATACLKPTGVCGPTCSSVPSSWALLGCFAVLLNVPMLERWGQSYWGGAVAMFGGALFFGGLARLRRDLSAGP